MASNNWKTATSGVWSAPGQWSTGSIPVVSDDVFLNQAGVSPGYVVTFDVAAATINSLTLQAAFSTLKFGPSPATLTVTNAVTVNAGNLTNATAGSTLNAGSVTVAGGSVQWGAGNLNVSGAVSVSSGSFSINASSGTMTAASLSATGGVFSILGGTVAVAGLANFANANYSILGSLQAGTMTLGGGDTLTVAGVSTVKVTGAAANSLQVTAGTKLSLQSTSATVDASAGGINLLGTIGGFGTVKGPINGTGSIIAGNASAASGTLDIVGNITKGVVLGIATNATKASTLLLDGTAEAASALSLTSSSQNLRIGAAGALTIDQAQTVAAATIAMAGGSLTDASGIVFGAGATAGFMQGFGTVNANLTSGLVSPATGGRIAADGGVLDLKGSVGSNLQFQILDTAATALKIDGTATSSFGIGNAAFTDMRSANQTLEVGATGALTIAQQQQVSNGLIKMSGGSLNDTKGIVLGRLVDSGTLSGFGTVTANLTSSGTGTANDIIASSGSLSIVGTIGTGLNLKIDSTAGSTLRLSSTVGAGDVVTFLNTTGNSGTLYLSNGTAISSFGANGAVANMAVGVGGAVTDRIDFASISFSTVHSTTIAGSTVNLWTGFGGAGSLLASFNLTAPVSVGVTAGFANDGSGGTDVFLVCYAAGTAIRTQTGETAVETLLPGDMVAVLNGDQTVFQPVKWVGVRHLDLTGHPHPEHVAPVRIQRGAIAEGMPARDLVLSPDHCLFLNGGLIPVKLLVNGMTITQARDAQAVSYFHVEMERHSILLAEGVPAESYLDTGNRAFFTNAGLALMLHPECHVNAGLRHWETDACAPLTVSQALVAPIWHELAARAEALGHTPPEFATTDDADIHLMVDGRAVYPIAVSGGRHRFALPRGARSVRLKSRADIPGDLIPALDDWRYLGVRISQMTLRSGDEYQDIPADHPGLRQGWHPVERAAGGFWRWTNGDALLPVATGHQAGVLDIVIDHTISYRIDGAASTQRMAA